MRGETFSDDGNLSMLPGRDGGPKICPQDRDEYYPGVDVTRSLHQVTSMAMGMPELGLGEITTETYLVDGKMYMGAPDLETGKLNGSTIRRPFCPIWKCSGTGPAVGGPAGGFGGVHALSPSGDHQAGRGKKSM